MLSFAPKQKHFNQTIKIPMVPDNSCWKEAKMEISTATFQGSRLYWNICSCRFFHTKWSCNKNWQTSSTLNQSYSCSGPLSIVTNKFTDYCALLKTSPTENRCRFRINGSPFCKRFPKSQSQLSSSLYLWINTAGFQLITMASQRLRDVPSRFKRRSST